MKILMKIILPVVLFASIFTGCSSEKDNQKIGQEYSIYYLEQSNSELVCSKYSTETEDADALIEELWNELKTSTEDKNVTTVPASIQLNTYRIENNILYLNFDESYYSMDKITEMLFRAALVRTFVQINGVDCVYISIADKPLTSEDGTPVGKMVASDFVDIIGKDINSVQSTSVVYYFTNEAGDKLLKKTAIINYTSNFSLERYVVEQLIAGPSEEGLYPTLPKNLRLLGTSVKDNVCYVNFDSTFLSDALNVKDYIPVYSVVNTLAELPNIRKVQILINGSANVMFKDSISFLEPFDRDLDYIGEMTN